MVCRENKGRSSMIGLAKAYQVAMGHPVDHDANLQSMQHQLRHEVEAADIDAKMSGYNTWTKAEQIAAWKELKSRVVDLPEDLMSESRRSSTSKTNPGIVTRLDQEIARLETGKHENGKTLTNAQRNTGADMVASMKLVSVMERLVPSRRNFLENQARRRGVPYSQMEAEWRELVNAPGNFSNIRLTDDWRETLRVSGVNAQDQANLGQSGRARDAMARMEADTQASLKKHREKNPPRDSLTDDHVLAAYAKPAGSEQVRCEACGQFGHENPACPNGDLVAELDAISERGAILDRHESVLKRRQMLAAQSPEAIQAVFDANVPGMTVDKFKAAIDADEAALGEPAMDEAQLQKQRKMLDKKGTAATEELETRAPKVSNWVQSVSYNPDNGLLMVTHHPYTNKNGVTKQSPPRYFRARPEQVEELMDNPSIGKALHADFLAKNRVVTAHEFENAADLEESLSETRCPTCGRWASLNGNHQCVVIGGPSEEVDHVRRMEVARYQAQARAARQNGKPVPVKPPKLVQSLSGTTDTSGYVIDAHDNKISGALRSGDRKEAQATVAAGDMWTSPVTFAGADDTWHVTGNVAMWRDPETGDRLIGIDGQTGHRPLKCQCPDYQERRRCQHVLAVGRRLAMKYEAKPVTRHTRAGESRIFQEQGRSNDGSALPPERLSYDTMSEMRVESMRSALAAADTHGIAQLPQTLWPTTAKDAATGEVVDEPIVWARNPETEPRKSKPVDLNNTAEVVTRMRKLSHSKTQLVPEKKTLPDGSTETVMVGRRFQYSFKAEPDGSILMNLPPNVLRDHSNPQKARALEAHLRKTMNLPKHAKIVPHGYRIPAGRATRYAALDAISGDPKRLTVNRMYDPADGSFAAAQGRTRAGNTGRFAPA